MKRGYYKLDNNNYCTKLFYTVVIIKQQQYSLTLYILRVRKNMYRFRAVYYYDIILTGDGGGGGGGRLNDDTHNMLL